MVKEFKSYKTISGTLEDFYSKTRSRSVGLTRHRARETSYFFKLREYPTLFSIGRLSKKAFDWEKFSQLESGTKISLKVKPSYTSTNENTITPSLIWTEDEHFIDAKIRDLERKKNGWLAFTFIFIFTAGLIHHIKKPWI